MTNTVNSSGIALVSRYLSLPVSVAREGITHALHLLEVRMPICRDSLALITVIRAELSSSSHLLQPTTVFFQPYTAGLCDTLSGPNAQDTSSVFFKAEKTLLSRDIRCN